MRLILNELKIVKYFVNIMYFLGNSTNRDEKLKLIDYLENVFNCKIKDRIKEELLNNLFTKRQVNYFCRRYEYLVLNGDKELEELDDVIEVYNIAKESISYLTKLELIVDEDEMSYLKSIDMIKSSLKKNYVLINYTYGVACDLGILFDENKKQAIEYYTKNALWNDEFSILCLAYDYAKNDNYIDSLYYYKLANKLGYISEDFYKALNKKVTKEELKTVNERIDKDFIIHDLLNDERSSYQYNPDRYDPNLSRVLYQGSFDLCEKKLLLFSKQKTDYSVISALVFSNDDLSLNPIKYNFRINEQKKIHDILSRMIRKKNNNPIIITCKSKIIMAIFSEYIDGYFEGSVVKDLDVTRCDNNSLTRYQASNNYLYQVFTSNETDNVVIKYHNLHKIKEGSIDQYISLLLPENKYYFQDIKVSADKSNLINIIFSLDINELDNRIVHSSNVIDLDKALASEKREIVQTKFSMELVKKSLSPNVEFDKIVDSLVEKVNYNKLNEAINEVVSRLNFGDKDDVSEVISEFSSSKGIGF